MRKYQQLLLLLLTCGSVAVLLMYKSENNRLKYVLSVVNFFGRSDQAVLQRLENITKDAERNEPDFTHPLPVWQAIGEHFHAYAAHWSRNELIAGGEASAIVTGKRGAVVNFRCALSYDGGTRSVQGKFRFQRADSEFEDALSDFTSYSFFCRLTRDFGLPEHVAFTDATAPNAGSATAAQKLRLRHVRTPTTTTTAGATTVPRQQASLQLATVCVDLASNYNASSSLAKHDNSLLQFFLHHQILGVEHFIVYNGDEVPRPLLAILRRLKMHIHLLPFNFPFERSANATERIRRLVETDCLMRNTNHARHTLLLAPNEFFQSNVKIADARSAFHSLHHHGAEVTRFELTTYGVCLDTSHKLLADNAFYDPELRPPHRLYIYRPHVPTSTNALAASQHSIALPPTLALVLRYVECSHVGKDGLHDWRNSLREDFAQHLRAVRDEVDLLI